MVSVEVDPSQGRPLVTFRGSIKTFKPHYEQFCSDNQLMLQNVGAPCRSAAVLPQHVPICIGFLQAFLTSLGL